MGLELTDCEIMAWAKVRRLNDWATQAPQDSTFLKEEFKKFTAVYSCGRLNSLMKMEFLLVEAATLLLSQCFIYVLIFSVPIPLWPQTNLMLPGNFCYELVSQWPLRADMDFMEWSFMSQARKWPSWGQRLCLPDLIPMETFSFDSISYGLWIATEKID